MKAKFTKGPWYLSENGLAGYGDNGPNFYITQKPDDYHGDGTIATLNLEHRVLDHGETSGYLKAKANGHLMAAAPELYEALTNLWAVCDANSYEVPMGYRNQIFKALALARGETLPETS